MPKKRSNLFKLGRRGRRGRVAYNDRWGRIFRDVESEVLRVLGGRRVADGAATTTEGSSMQRNLPQRDTIPKPLDHLSSPDPNPTHGRNTSSELNTPPSRPSTPLSPVNDNDGQVVAALIDGITDTQENAVGDMPVTDNDGMLDLLDHMPLEDEDDEDVQYVQQENMDGAGDAFTDEAPMEIGSQQVESADGPGMGQPNPADQRSATLPRDFMLKAVQKVSTWQNIIAVLVASGSVRFSVAQYEKFRNCENILIHKGFNGESMLPAYSTIERTLSPILSSVGLVGSEKFTKALDFTKAGTSKGRSGDRRVGHFVVVKPSTWSAMDVSYLHSWEQLKRASIAVQNDTNPCAFQYVESTPIIRRREEILSAPFLFSGQSVNGSPIGELFMNEVLSNSSVLNVYKIHFRNGVQFPESLLNNLHTLEDTRGNVTAITMRALTSSLVTNAGTHMETSKPSRRDVKLGSLSCMKYQRAGLWYAGDICTFMYPGESVTDQPYVCILVHHQARPGQFSRRIEFVYIPYSIEESDQEPVCFLRWLQAHRATVTTVTPGDPNQELRRTTTPSGTMTTAPSYGRLATGMRYFVDHILLYSDGFSQYSFKQGSSGGVYSISLNYPPHLRRTRDRVRVLSLTPLGISTKEALRAIIPDLVTSCTEGVKARNAEGEEVLVFVDVVGYVGDYLEVGHVLDVVGPNGVAPCHLCSFLRYKGHFSTASKYGSVTDVHSDNSCYARTGERTKALRASDITGINLNLLGLNSNEDADAKASPLFELYETLTERMKTARIPLTEQGVAVLKPRFDPYRSVFVAPDHLLAGIAINEMTLAFKLLPNIRRRKQADVLICGMLRSNGLQYESQVYHEQKSALHSTSISGTFCRLLVSAPILTELVDNVIFNKEMPSHVEQLLRDSIKNLNLFRKLVSQTYWYPTRNVDDPLSVLAFNDDNGMTYIAAVQKSCVEYITNCNDICKRSELATSELDKPNLHRLLELYTHSIPALGHIHHFAELVFECAHQPLKRAMTRSNLKSSHLQSMMHCKFDDWKQRMAAAYAGMADYSDVEDNIACLMNLLCGRDDEVMASVLDDHEYRARILSLLENEMIKKTVGNVPTHLDSRSPKAKWILSGQVEEDKVPCVAQVQDLLTHYVAF